jgi:hypothetical protein
MRAECIAEVNQFHPPSGSLLPEGEGLGMRAECTIEADRAYLFSDSLLPEGEGLGMRAERLAEDDLSGNCFQTCRQN